MVPEAREVFKNLPDTRGVIFPEYEPVASHGDHFHAQNDSLSEQIPVLGTSISVICDQYIDYWSPIIDILVTNNRYIGSQNRYLFR